MKIVREFWTDVPPRAVVAMAVRGEAFSATDTKESAVFLASWGAARPDAARRRVRKIRLTVIAEEAGR